jgi:Oxidoreductase family, NAD-binding Rossmann fold/Oxidoreductase family, C-terminal alpha/beta domain
MNRRRFLKISSLATGAAYLGFPAFLRARNLNSKLGVALIGVGFQGRFRLNEVLQGGLPVDALCDVDSEALAKSKTLFSATKNPLPKTYTDYRELLASDIDAVVIATPDHWHAPMAAAALKAGKHVFCEKPLTHTISEARALRQVAAGHATLSTQMGNQGSASPFMRRGIEIVQAGGIGQVSEVHVWVPPSHSFKPGQEAPVGEDAVPSGLDWDRWIGVAPFHPYKSGAYTPKTWRAWYDFGGGSIADWGCHGLNFPFRSLKLDYPNHIDPNVQGSYTYGYPKGVRLRFDFGRRGDLEPVTVWWYDGGRKPDAGIVPKNVVEHLGKIPDGGCLLLGEKGFTFGDPANPGVQYIQLYSEAKLSGITNHSATASVARTLPRVQGHVQEWVDACNGGPSTFSDFETGGHLTEIALSGVVALRARKALVWNGVEMRAENDPEAEKFIQAHYRPGWCQGSP